MTCAAIWMGRLILGSGLIYLVQAQDFGIISLCSGLNHLGNTYIRFRTSIPRIDLV